LCDEAGVVVCAGLVALALDFYTSNKIVSTRARHDTYVWRVVEVIGA